MVALILTTLFVVGTVLGAIGYLRPQMSGAISTKINEFWNKVAEDNWADVPVQSVRFFVESGERAAYLTTQSARNLFVVIPVIIGSLAIVLFIIDQPEGAVSNDWSLVSLLDPRTHPAAWAAAGVALAAVLIFRYFEGPLVVVARFVKLSSERVNLYASRRSFTGMIKWRKDRIKEFEEQDEPENGRAQRSRKARIDRLEWEIHNLQGLRQEITTRIETVSEEISSIFKSNLIEKAIGSLFRIFLISTLALFFYVYFNLSYIFQDYYNALFGVGPLDAFINVFYILAPLVVVFLLLQMLVPAFIILLNPESLQRRLELQAGHNRSKLNDPLGTSRVFLFLFGITVSLMLTYSAFVIGHLIDPEAYVPQTFQMVAANAIFDGLTFSVTLFLLGYLPVWDSDNSKTILILAGLVIADLIVAALLAVCSAYFGLLGTEAALPNLTDYLWLLVGVGLGGQGTEFGPLFWVMHTAFIPTIIYLIYVVTYTLAKAVMALVVWTTKEAVAENRGLAATGAFLLILVGLFQAIWFGFAWS
ncbi:hypothetical protein [Hyphobacterium sp.]|uniref:hypothetical protein n=1 Tax=Hyphobacterium sp. TaxID=2004662 RepID=UPI0037481B25